MSERVETVGIGYRLPPDIQSWAKTKLAAQHTSKQKKSRRAANTPPRPALAPTRCQTHLKNA